MGVMVGWKSWWYVFKEEFVNLFFEDYKVCKFIKNYFKKDYKVVGIDWIEIECMWDEVKVVLYVVWFGLIIGKKGMEVEFL